MTRLNAFHSLFFTLKGAVKLARTMGGNDFFMKKLFHLPLLNKRIFRGLFSWVYDIPMKAQLPEHLEILLTLLALIAAMWIEHWLKERGIEFPPDL